MNKNNNKIKKIMKKGYFKTKAQTLIETLVALSIITLILGAAYGIIIQGLKVARLSLEKTQAYNLAQEGIEQVRYLRDLNYCNGNLWSNINFNNIPQGPFFNKFTRTVGITDTELNNEKIIKMTIISRIAWTDSFGGSQVFELKEILYDTKSSQ